MKLADIRFTTYLGIMSIAGFTTILIKNSVNVDISAWVDAFLFIVIGFALFVSGGYNLIFSYFKNGLTPSEVNKIVTVVIGVLSMMVGLLALPMLGIDVDKFATVRIIISIVAIISILFEMLTPKK